MKIVIASDSFKESLTSVEVAQAATRGIKAVYPNCEVVAVNVADGGEGTVEAIVDALGGEIICTSVSDPLGRPIQARYGIASKKAIIEMAAASGLPLLQPAERNPWMTSTYGTGEMIMDAIQRGCSQFLVGIGGSATNDAGTGMLQALGFKFYDFNGKEITDCRGGRLQDIADLDDTFVSKAVRETQFIVACDVDTPFCGPEGAAPVFAPQKGADTAMVQQLDAGMVSFANVIEDKYHINIVPIAGAGAAGGMGGAFRAFLHATLKRGIDMVLDAIDFNAIIQNADLVITGEGKIDFQTAKGKTAAGVLTRAKQQGIPVVAIGGSVEMCDSVQQMGFAGVYPILGEKVPLEVAMQPDFAATNVENTIRRILPSHIN
ncbi:MAG: glycerate kinase [Paludibacteraceae bacterium]|nr:glycerate kinase [Paludibacteraceae bacterium]